MSLLLAAQEVTFGLAGERFPLADPPASAAMLAARVCRLDDRRRRHWSPADLAGLALAVIPDEHHLALMGVLADRLRPVTLRAMSEAVMWAVEAVVGRGFGEVHVLSSWACVNDRALRGRVLLGGARPAEAYSLADLLDMSEAFLAERGVAGKVLADAVVKAWQSRDEWGMTSAAEAAQRAMMGL